MIYFLYIIYFQFTCKLKLTKDTNIMNLYKPFSFHKIINLIGLIFLILFCIIFYKEYNSLSFLYENDIINKTAFVQKQEIILFVFICIVLLTFAMIFYFEKLILNNHHSNTLYINRIKTFNSFYSILHATKGIKNISDVSLEFISNQLKASSSCIYIANYKNMNLQLLGTYKQSINKTSQIIDMYSGLIGTSFSTQTIQATYQKNITHLTIPLIDDEKSIGVMELSFCFKLDKQIITEQINHLIKIISSTLLKELEHEKNKKYFKLIDKNVIISSTNTEGRITFVSEAFCNATLYNKKELLNNNHRILRHPDVQEEIFCGMWSTIKSGKSWNKELPNIKKDGSTYWAKTSITPELDFYGNIIGYDAIREDITDKKLIEQISIEDPLTKLYNRRYFDKVIQKQINIAKRFQKILIFSILDIDHFKQYNDTYGHQEGDYALIKVANSLKQSLKRENDFIFRLGGEEFGLLYFVEEQNEGMKIANKVRENIEQLKISHSKNSASQYITISCGLFIYSGENENVESIYKKADALLYKAKQNGRNQIYVS